MRRKWSGSRGGRGRWIVAGLLAGLGVLAYGAHQQAIVFAQRALNVVFSNADTEAKGIWFAWNGDVVARDVVLYLDGPTAASPGAATADTSDPAAASAEANTVRYGRMHLRAPGGWAFYLRNLLDRRLERAHLDALHVSFGGVDTPSGMEPTLGQLGPVGGLSASPFETEGCLRPAHFMHRELAEMGLSAGRTTLDFDLRQVDSRVTTRIVLSTPGASRAQYDREETLAKPSSLFKLGQVPTATHAERWEISDDGFVRARNAYCAKQDGVAPQAFVARHLASVQRLLETRGLVPDAQTIAAYASFAEKGGQFAFGGAYDTPLHSSERDGVHKNGSAWLRMRGSVEHGGRKGEVQWRGTKPRPLDAAGDATFAAMTKENGGIPPAVGALSLAPQAQEAIAAALVASAAPATPQVAPAAAAQAPAAVPATAPVQAAPQRPQYASSLPAAQPQLAPAGGRLAWDDLPRYQGRILQVFTMHAEPRTAVLVSANGNEARVRARMEGGHADYRISRESFVRALLVQ